MIYHNFQKIISLYGVKIDEFTRVPGLLYEDDLAIFADSDDNLIKHLM